MGRAHLFPSARGAGWRGSQATPCPARRRLRRVFLEDIESGSRPEPRADSACDERDDLRPERRRKMTRYLVYTSPARGHLYPIVPTLEEMRRRGHEVVVRTLASEGERMRGLGFEAAAMDPAIERREIDDWQARTPVGALRASLRGFFDRAHHDGPDLLRAIEEEHPDALLVDVNTWGAMAVAENAGLPWVTWCPYFLPVPSNDTPPFGLGLPPARGTLGRLRDRLLRPALFAMYNRLLPELNAVRAELGAPPLRDIPSAMVRAPLMLYMPAEPFEYPRADWPESTRMVGPGIWDPPVQPPA